jgi:phosphoglycolate phosphatase
MAIRTVIFDFDGTLVDSLDVFIEAARGLGQQFGIPADTDIDALRKKHPLHILRRDLQWNWIKIGRFIRAMRPLVYAETKKLPLRPGVKKVISQLEKTFTVGILTSNSQDVVQAVLAREHVGVAFINGGSSLFGKHTALKGCMRKLDLKKEETVYVGDEIRDIEACRKVGIRVIAVAWGTNTRQCLADAKPDFIVDQPEQLLTVIARMEKS